MKNNVIIAVRALTWLIIVATFSSMLALAKVGGVPDKVSSIDEAPDLVGVFTIVPDESVLGFKGVANPYKFEGKTSKVYGTISGNPKDITGTGKIEVYFKVNTLKTGIGTRDSKMRELMKASRSSKVKFVSTGVVVKDLGKISDNEITLVIKGDLTIAGITRPVSAQINITYDPDAQKLTAITEFPVKLSTFKIPAPELLIAKMDDKITIYAKIVAELKEVHPPLSK